MRVYRVPSEHLEIFNSSGVLLSYLPEAIDATLTRTTFAQVRAGGTIGLHRAPLAQAFAIVSGSGFVCDANAQQRGVETGHLIVFEQGEEHQTWAATDLQAIIVETDGQFSIPEDFLSKKIKRNRTYFLTQTIELRIRNAPRTKRTHVGGRHGWP